MERVWLWPNLLSLDAPIVALLWQILFARCFHARVDLLPSVLLVLAVWLIYAADRTLDAWTGSSLRPRHEFYRRHWRALLPLWLLVLAAGSALAWRLTPQLLLSGMALGAAVLTYFALLHHGIFQKTKEAAVALLFGLGATLSAWPNVRTAADIEAIALFSCLCWINCVAIEHWEGESEWPIAAAAGFVALAAVLLLLFSNRPVLGGAVAASALAFVLLDCARRHFSRDALRVLADVALLSPLFLLPVAGMHF
ncbi:MAG TPA: hypothetical protein VK752_27880 [Bryobacteraceae bacterium]|nr:hypothetical protein [Bryobacteraceae bacterium]